jgi:hypothetical protein
LFVEWRININKNETIRKLFSHGCGVKRLSALRTLRTFVFGFAIGSSAPFILDWGKAQSH